MKNKIACLGITDCILYFIIVASFIIFKTDWLLTLWEVFTILSAPIILIVLLEILKEVEINSTYKLLTILSMGCTILLTSVAHFTSITVTRQLISDGIKVPTYFQIGYWPSLEMSIDYLAWGLFMGLAFITTGMALKQPDLAFKQTTGIISKLRITLFLCGCLCLIGLLGTVIINKNCWYIAPLGYGFGTIVICIEMIMLGRDNK